MIRKLLFLGLVVLPTGACRAPDKIPNASSEIAMQGSVPTDSPPISTMEAVFNGMECKQSTIVLGQMECTYSISSDLKITIAGVGEEEAAIYFDRSAGLDGDYYAAVGMAHGCVIVKQGEALLERSISAGMAPTLAFISHRTGRVYEDWQSCGAATALSSNL